MSRANPRKAIDALVPSPITIDGGIVVRPLTLGMYALLERFKSPLVTGRTDCDTLDIIPSLYALTHDPTETLYGGDILVKSMQWADTLPPRILEQIHSAAMRQIQCMVDVLPEASPQKKKGTTAG